MRLVDGLCEVVLFGWNAAKLLEFGGILATFDTFSLLGEVACGLVLWRRQFSLRRRLVRLVSTIFVQIDPRSHLLDDQNAGVVVVKDGFRSRLGGCAV